MKLSIKILFFLILSLNLWAHDEEMDGADVGPDKGILEAHEESGFKLSPEAEKQFELKRIKITSELRVLVPTTALVSSGNEFFVYRYRAGFYKHIDVTNATPSGHNLVEVSSFELAVGDEIVSSGVAFLRVSEMAVFGTEEHEHEHEHHNEDQHKQQ